MSSAPPVLAGDKLAHLPQRLIIGVSGGVDSCALLHALATSGDRHLIVAHFNHRWRGSESDADAAFVQGLAEHYNLAFEAGTARTNTPHTESAARDERWCFFTVVAQRTGIPDIALAHQADDQVETFLWQLIRGGASGGVGMREIGRRNDLGLTVHRPWLSVWKHEILAYATGHQLEWREDASNQQAGPRRNRIRLQLLPQLAEDYHPQAAQAIWRAASIRAEESTWMDDLCRDHATQPELSVAALRAMPIAQTRRIIRLWFLHHGIEDIAFEDIEAARFLLHRIEPAKINLAADRAVRRKEGRLFIDAQNELNE